MFSCKHFVGRGTKRTGPLPPEKAGTRIRINENDGPVFCMATHTANCVGRIYEGGGSLHVRTRQARESSIVSTGMSGVRDPQGQHKACPCQESGLRSDGSWKLWTRKKVHIATIVPPSCVPASCGRPEAACAESLDLE
eukprot:scaffold114137_cov18-Tisochrysis_lutea.AAC.2